MSAALLQYRALAPEIVRFKSEAAVTRLTAVIHKPVQPVGAATGQATNEDMPVAVAYAGVPASGVRFVGVSLADVINADLTTRPRSGLKPSDQVVGEPFPISDFCEVLLPAASITGVPTPNAAMFLGTNSTFAVVNPNASLAAVGVWRTAPDANGAALALIRAAIL